MSPQRRVKAAGQFIKQSINTPQNEAKINRLEFDLVSNDQLDNNAVSRQRKKRVIQADSAPAHKTTPARTPTGNTLPRRISDGLLNSINKVIKQGNKKGFRRFMKNA